MDGRFVVDPDEVDSRCVCKQLFSSVERDLCIIVFFPREIFIHYRPFCLCTIRIFHFERTSWIYSAFVTLLFVAWYLFFPLFFFLNNLNNRINKCLLFDVNCETLGRGCNKNSQLLYNMNIYIYWTILFLNFSPITSLMRGSKHKIRQGMLKVY